MARQQEKLKFEEEKRRQRKKEKLLLEHQKLMKNRKIHPQSQVVFWCDEDEQEKVFTEWRTFTGIIKSGKNKGKIRKLSRLQPNSACLLTAKVAGAPEKERRIIGVFMVKEDFIGKLNENGYIPAHPKYRIRLNEEQSKQLPSGSII